MDLIAALRRLHADAVLIDRNGKAWTAEDLEYTLLDEIRDQQWNRQTVQLTEDGIYHVGQDGRPDELLYAITEEVGTTS
ncbi:MAG TPA: hypothetical protein PLP42_14015 [Acidobacteriota bacterium]|mgnify:CR=1 FL=1|nr:hypothetical protein [Acidobacteriota bacterium]